MSVASRVISAPWRLYAAVRHEVSEEIAKQRRLTLANGGGWSQFSGRTSKSGKVVTLDTALQLSAVWACIKVTAQAVSSLPLAVYERVDDDDRVRVHDGAIAELLTDSPNADQTPLEYWEGVVGWLLASGNAYSEIVKSGPRITALQPIGSTMCRPIRLEDGTLVYRIVDRGKTEDLPRDKVFHIKGFGQALGSMDMGLSPVAAGVNSMGAAMAAQDAAASVFANGLRPTGFFLFDQQLTPEQRIQAKKVLIDPLAGADATGGVGILEAGVKWQSVSLNPEDAQMLDTRRFDVEEICRWFGVPPIIIGHSGEGQTMWGSGVEQILISWLTLGIDPICDRIEARVKKQLIRPSGNRRQYAEFNREALLQMDSKAKAAFLSAMVQNGLMSRGEGRAKLNLPRKNGTDGLTAQTNLAPLEKLGTEAGAQQLRQAMLAFLGPQQEGETNE